VVDPISLRAGVVGDGWLPRTARAMAHAGQQGTSREAAATAAEVGRVQYSRSSFERVTHLVGALTVAAHRDIEDTLIDASAIPVAARSLSEMARTTAEACALPGTLGNIGLAGQQARIAQLHQPGGARRSPWRSPSPSPSLTHTDGGEGSYSNSRTQGSRPTSRRADWRCAFLPRLNDRPPDG
jgi:hypothetical protein